MAQSNLALLIFRRVAVRIWSIGFIFIAMVPTSLAACSGSGSLVEEMNSAYEAKKKDVSEVVRKHIPSGMDLSHALDLLEERGFQVTEFMEKGFRKWPDGVVHPYQDEAHKRSALGELDLVYTAKKSFENYLISRKEAVVGLDVNEGRVSASRGYIHVHGL